MSIGQDLLNVPMGDMIRDMAFAIADGQFQLDQSGMRTAEMMGGLQTVIDAEGKQTFDDSRVFFGYEYMTVEAALAYAIFDDSLTGAIDADTIKLKDVVLETISALDGLADSERTKVETAAESGTSGDIKKIADSVRKTIIRVPTRLSMLELGFSPTFYQFVDTIIEVKIAIRMTRSFESTTTTSRSSSTKDQSYSIGLRSLFSRRNSPVFGRSNGVQTTQVDATYSSKYSYSAEGASLLRTKMAPLPGPAILEERIRNLVALEDEMRRSRLKALEGDPNSPDES